MTIKKRFIIAYLSTILITLFSIFLIFSFISYSSLGRVPSLIKVYRILTTQRPLTDVEKRSYIEMNEVLTKSPALLQKSNHSDLLDIIHSIENKKLNVVIRKDSEFTYFSPELLERSLKVHSPKYELNNFDPTGTIDNNGRFYHYIKRDFKYEDGSKGSFMILRRESNLFEFFIKWGIWVVIFILAISIFAFWYISMRIRKTIIQPLIALEKNTRDIINEKEISGLDAFTEVENSSKEIEQLQQSFKKMWNDLYIAQAEKKKYEENRKELVSNISHDLKTPITSIIGYVEGIKDGVANTDEKREAYINTIHEKSLTLNEMIDELFLYSKLDIDSLKFEMKKVDFIQYIQNIVEEFKWDDKIDVTLNVPKHKLMTMIDIVQFDRVMNNLIQNSIKFKNDKNEKLKLDIDVVCINGFVKLSFSDNGVGIEEKDLSNIFFRFYRADKSRTSTVKGSGLGLSIVKQIVENHKGSVEAQSEIGVGTTIIICLPIVS